jgi:hypothetical protein
MEIEHCDRSGANDEFETVNYHIRTTPGKEWNFVQGLEKCPAEQMTHNRRIPKVQDLLELDTAKEAKLKEPEIIAILLYTGPMVGRMNYFPFFCCYFVTKAYCCSI